jgi:hypothetical protein
MPASLGRLNDLVDEVLKAESRRGETTTVERVTDLTIREMKKRGGLEAFGAVAMKRGDLESLIEARFQAPMSAEDFAIIEGHVALAVAEYLEHHGPELQASLSEENIDAHRSRAIAEYLRRHGFESLADALQQERATVRPAEQSKRVH